MPARYGVRVVVVGFSADRPLFQAQCHWPDCGWRSGDHVVKAGANDDARWHRQTHRTQVAA